MVVLVLKETLHTGTTEIGEGLFVGKKNNGGVDKFTVASASGNTDIQGTLNGKGAARLTIAL